MGHLGLRSEALAERLGVRLDVMAGSGRWHLFFIVVPKELRGQGLGEQVMQALIEDADDAGVTITLTPTVLDSPGDKATSRARLVRFYRRFGFVENKGRNKDFSFREAMYRLPRIKV